MAAENSLTTSHATTTTIHVVLGISLLRWAITTQPLQHHAPVVAASQLLQLTRWQGLVLH
jgi:hypothetical protein